jgi:propionyl-CoA synthetase
LSTALGTNLNDLCVELVQRASNVIGPVATFKLVTSISRLPKTQSGKKLRGTMRKIANDEESMMPATIEDPIVMSDVAEALRHIGYSQDLQ